MDDRLEAASDAIGAARGATGEPDVRDQLGSIRDGLAQVDEQPLDEAQEGDRVEEIERQLVGLGNDADDEVTEHLETARDELDAYRRESAREWERDADRDGGAER